MGGGEEIIYKVFYWAVAKLLKAKLVKVKIV